MLYDDVVISKLLFSSDELKQNTISIQLANNNFLLERSLM